MTEVETPGRADWVVPAVLVGAAAVLVVIALVVVGVRASGSDDDSVAGQLEEWSSCLRSQGANVPLVEAVRGGGFRVTVDGSLLNEGLDRDALGPAMDACSQDAPERLRSIMTLIDGMHGLSFGGFGDGLFDLGDSPHG